MQPPQLGIANGLGGVSNNGNRPVGRNVTHVNSGNINYGSKSPNKGILRNKNVIYYFIS